MVEHILGNYLVETNKITGEQLDKVIARLNEVRVKMGLLAVLEGMMTVEQADEVNRFQATTDKRFGDIAVEKGYLTEIQISNLLKKQGNAYLAFAQALVNAELLEMEELEEVMDGFQKQHGFTKSEMEDLRSDQPERIVPMFLPHDAMGFADVAGVLVRTLIRCVDRQIYIGKAVLSNEVSIKESAFQKTVGFSKPVMGFKELETGLAEVNGGLSILSHKFCKEQFDLEKEDVLDAAAEFLNCVNGLYAAALSRGGINSQLLPPIFFESELVVKDMEICSIPIFVGGKEAVFIIWGHR